MKTVFIVDDDLTNLKIGKNALSNSYYVYALDSGAEMLKLTENVVPDLILLDINMPGMDGYETLKKIRNTGRIADVPVIFLTARDQRGEIMQGLSHGPDDYITKPFLPDHLIERVRAHLAG